jgi:hypothetical protein
VPTHSDITFAQLRTLHDVSKKVNSQLDLPILLNEIMGLAIGLLHAEKGLILLREEASGEFVSNVFTFRPLRSLIGVKLRNTRIVPEAHQIMGSKDFL